MKVMTPKPECATVDTPILDALKIMHEGKFLHLPVMDRDGNIVSVVDVINITHAAVATFESSGGMGKEAAISMMQKFWDSAMALGLSDEDEDTQSEGTLKMVSEGGMDQAGLSPAYPPPGLVSTFSFKLEDRKGRMHRFNCDTRSMTDLLTCILQRAGDDIDRDHLPQILYEDEDRDEVILASDGDLAVAVDHARLAGWKGLKLVLDYSGSVGRKKGKPPRGSMDYANRDAWAAAYSAVAAGAALAAGLGVMVLLRRMGSIGK